MDAVRLRDDLRAEREALLRAGFLAFAADPRLLDFVLAFGFFLMATVRPSLGRLSRPALDHTIGPLRKGGSPRIVVEPSAGGVSIEIRPLVRTRGARWRLAALAAAVLACALLGGARLARVWEAGLRRGTFEDLPLEILLPVSLAVGLSTPLALLGLAALAFAEERIDITPDSVRIRTTAFERTQVRVIARGELTAWQETYRPLPPWWTWAFRRLAARAGGSLVPLAGAAGHSEKRAIGLTLARATGVPLIGTAGREVAREEAVKIPR